MVDQERIHNQCLSDNTKDFTAIHIRISSFINQNLNIPNLAIAYISIGIFINQYLHTWYYAKYGSLFASLFSVITVKESYLACLFLFPSVLFILYFVFEKINNPSVSKLGLYLMLIFPFLEILSQIASRSMIKLCLDFPIVLIGFGFLFISQQYGEKVQNKCNDLRILYDEVKSLINISVSVFTAVIITTGLTFVPFVYTTKYPNSTANWYLILYISFVLIYIAFGFLIGIIGQLYTYLVAIRVKITENISNNL